MGQREHILTQCERAGIDVTEHLTGPRAGLISFRYCRVEATEATLEEGWDRLLAMQEQGKLPEHEWEYGYDPCGKSWETCSRCGRTRRL